VTSRDELGLQQVHAPEGGFPGSFLICLFSGFLLGLGVAAGIAIISQDADPLRRPTQAQDKPLAATRKRSSPRSRPRRTKSRVSISTASSREGGARSPSARYASPQSKRASPARPRKLLPPRWLFPESVRRRQPQGRLALMGMEANSSPPRRGEGSVVPRAPRAVHPRRRDQRSGNQLTQNGLDVSKVRITDTATN